MGGRILSVNELVNRALLKPPPRRFLSTAPSVANEWCDSRAEIRLCSAGVVKRRKP
jgi:hypothetical protein